MTINKEAQMLGRLAKGIPKNYSKAERKRRASRMKLFNKQRRVEYSKRWKLKHYKQHLQMEKRRRNKKGYRKYMNDLNTKYRSTLKGRIDSRIGVRIRYCVRNNIKGHYWEKLLGYTVDDLKKHLISLFTSGMTWGKFLSGEIQFDHKIPKYRFRYKSVRDPKFKECWSLDNLQPLWAKDNLTKHTKTMEEWEISNEKYKNI